MVLIREAGISSVVPNRKTINHKLQTTNRQRNVKDLIKFYFVCKAFAKSGNELKARSIAGWGSACSGCVVFTKTV